MEDALLAAFLYRMTAFETPGIPPEQKSNRVLNDIHKYLI